MINAFLGVLALVAHSDTSVRVARGVVVRVEAHLAEIVIRGAAGDILTVRGGGLVQRGRTITVSPREIDGPVTISVPAGVSVSAESIEGEITVSAVEGDVSVETINGDIRVSGVRGAVDITTVSGDVAVDAITGRLATESVNGDITMRGIRAPGVTATTTNGEITFEGQPVDGGTYEFATHNGEVTLTLPGSLSARMQISTFNGEFDTAIPAATTGDVKQRPGVAPSRREFVATYGAGAARIVVDAFNGSIHVLRAR